MRHIYNIIIRLYGFSLWIFSLFNQKARDWFYGRRNLFKKLDEIFSIHYSNENPAPVIWIHCASLGEYEQGRPIIQEIKNRFPGFVVLLTFFSPSGFNNRVQNSDADIVFYLPIDTIRNARRFIRIVSPSLAIFVKYEFWYNYLNELHLSKIPTYTVSAIFRPDQHFFKWYGAWFRKHLRNLKKIFVQDADSAELLNMISIINVEVCGDTRFDRVTKLLETSSDFPVVRKFSSSDFTIVAGSTWPPDEDIIKKLLDEIPALKIIIAPHEVHQHHITELQNKFSGKAVIYSQINETDIISDYRVLIVDSIGLLSQLYKYGKIAYIGGGFGLGIHNTLEAAVYGMPVIFGPNYFKFREAHELITCKAGISIDSAEELIINVKRFMNSPAELEKASEAAKMYVQERRGATDIVMAEIEGLISNVISI